MQRDKCWDESSCETFHMVHFYANSLSYERFSRKPRFETEAQDNLEIAN